MKNFSKKAFVILVFIFGFSMPTYAFTTDSTTAEITVTAGSLVIVSPQTSVNFGNVTIDGTIKTLNSNIGTMGVEDLTGTGSGWNVTVQASQFSNGTNQLPTNILSLTGINTPTPNGTTSPIPTITGTAPYVLDAGSAVKILSAAPNTGMGKFNVTFPNSSLVLKLDTNQISSSVTPYSSTITWTIVSGP